MTDLNITREDSDTKDRHIAKVAGVEGKGELTLSKTSETRVIVGHTAVPDSLRGMGIAWALARQVMADARAAGQKIDPLCPFFKAYAERHKEDRSDVVS